MINHKINGTYQTAISHDSNLSCAICQMQEAIQRVRVLAQKMNDKYFHDEFLGEHIAKYINEALDGDNNGNE